VAVREASIVHTYRCKACGFEVSRHLVASWNIAKDGARHVPADCWQMQPMAERLVAAEKPSAEPEKILCHAGIRSDTEFQDGPMSWTVRVIGRVSRRVQVPVAALPLRVTWMVSASFLGNP
jgi:rubredoxin